MKVREFEPEDESDNLIFADDDAAVSTPVENEAGFTAWRQADDNHAVITRSGGKGTHRRSPCATCPWRVDATGEFPAEAFRISAHTAYDAAMETFGCHETSRTPNPVTCAGFLLRNAENNLGARLAQAHGKIDMSVVHDGGHALYNSYREMAVANGVHPDDPALEKCQDDEARPMRPKEEA